MLTHCGLKLLTATLSIPRPWLNHSHPLYAAYAGNATLPDVTFYGGIPYIKPPVGNLRFAPPQQLDEAHHILSNDDVVDARNWGPLCIQQPAVMGIGSEDCVTLNIWTPSNATSKSKLPVYVYIHGGGHYYNSYVAVRLSFSDAYKYYPQGTRYLLTPPVLLGLLGYLSGSAIRANPTSGPNNAAFGGDATKVTIGGQYLSGGGSVTLHLTAFGGEKNPPFRAAMVISLGADSYVSGNDPFYTTDHTEQCFGNVTKQVGCDVRAVIDGNYIPDITTKLLAAGKFTKVPILAGHNAQDGSIFVGTPTSIVTDADIITAILKRYPGLPTTLTDALLVTYPPASSTTPWTTQWERAMYAYMESELACWDYYIGNISGKPAFNYRWDAPDPNLIAARGAAELFYLYDGTNSGPSASVAQPVFSVFTAPQDALARQAVAWWSSFARTLDPNTFAAPGSPKWAPASAGGFMVAALSNDTASSVPSSGMAPRTDDYPKRCAWWRSVGTDLRL
ncbi:Alpha/Beta hydrolase protein [Mycena olivaceomarginata]|nr:Alpha/Beta hydrolase protein [Mycena olivaceomarginata]